MSAAVSGLPAAVVYPLGQLRLGRDVVEIDLAAGGVGLGVLACYAGAAMRGRDEERRVFVRLLEQPQTLVPVRLADVRPTGTVAAHPERRS